MPKVILFEPFDTDFGGHYFEYSATHTRFLMENGHQPIFVLGGKRTTKLEEFLQNFNIKYYKIGIPVYKARSKLPPLLKIPLNFFTETLRLIKLLKIAQKENSALISVLTFGVYEALQLLLAVYYTNCKIPITVTMHTITIEEKLSPHPKKILNHFLSFFHFVFLRHLINKRGIVKRLFFYSDASRDLYRRNVTKQSTKILFPVYFDYKNFNYTQQHSRELLQLPQNTPLLLIFNPDTRGKYINNLIKSLPLVNKHFKLVIVGYMSHKFDVDLKSLIKEHNLLDKVIIRNEFVDGKDKFHYINAVDISLLPYRDTYAKARTASSFFVECIMLKKPVIITTGVIETDKLIKDNKLGIVTSNTPKSWSDALNNFLGNFDKFINSAEENAPKIRDKYFYANVLDKVYSKDILS